MRGFQRARDDLAQRRLPEAGGGGVHRRQAARQRRVVAGFDEARMHHLQPEKTAAHFADEAEGFARLEQLAVAGIKMQEADAEHAAAGVAHRQGQHAARAVGDGGFRHRRLHLRGVARQQIADRRQPGFVFPAQRHVQHQIGVAGKAELGEFGRERRADGKGKRRRRFQLSRLYPMTITASASTSAPRGSAATPTAARAG